MQKGFIYNRVSTNIQEDKESIISQRESCKAFAKINNIDVLQLFEETGSGLIFNRPQFQEMLSRLVEVDCVITFSQDRITREPRHIFIIIDTFKKANVELLGVTGAINWNSTLEEMIVVMKSYMAKDETEKMSARIKPGIQIYKNEHGRWGRAGAFSDYSPETKKRRKDLEKYLKLGIKNYTTLGKLLGVHARTVSRHFKKNKLVV